MALDFLQHPRTAPRPDDASRVGFELDVSVAGGPPSRLAVDSRGSSCVALSGSDYLESVCELATLTDGAYIAAASFGRANLEEGPPAEAIRWRAWLSRDIGICESAGLEGDRRLRCESMVSSSEYQTSDGNLTVTLRR